MEKIKWWMLFISICVGIAGVVVLLDFNRLTEEITSLNKQIEQKDILIDYLKQEIYEKECEE